MTWTPNAPSLVQLVQSLLSQKKHFLRGIEHIDRRMHAMAVHMCEKTGDRRWDNEMCDTRFNENEYIDFLIQTLEDVLLENLRLTRVCNAFDKDVEEKSRRRKEVRQDEEFNEWFEEFKKRQEDRIASRKKIQSGFMTSKSEGQRT